MIPLKEEAQGFRRPSFACRVFFFRRGSCTGEFAMNRVNAWNLFRANLGEPSMDVSLASGLTYSSQFCLAITRYFQGYPFQFRCWGILLVHLNILKIIDCCRGWNIWPSILKRQWKQNASTSMGWDRFDRRPAWFLLPWHGNAMGTVELLGFPKRFLLDGSCRAPGPWLWSKKATFSGWKFVENCQFGCC